MISVSDPNIAAEMLAYFSSPFGPRNDLLVSRILIYIDAHGFTEGK